MASSFRGEQGGLVDQLAAKAVPFRPDLELGHEERVIEALAAIIGSADIVMLGEPSHGDGSSIRLRGRLVELLHRRFGFDVLAFEADFWSITRGWNAISSADQIRPFADQNLYDFWGRAPAADGLWTYVETLFSQQRRFDICGFDCRLKGQLARIGVIDALQSATAATGVSAEQFAGFRDGYTALQTQEFSAQPDLAMQERFFTAIDLMSSALQGADLTSDGQVMAELASLGAWAQVAWRGASRDEAMAQNLKWLITRKYPGRKVIVWAHNNHVLKDPDVYLKVRDPGPAQQIAAMSDVERSSLAYVGSVMSRDFPGRVRSIATTLGQGSTSIQFPKALDGSRIDFADTRPVPVNGADAIEHVLLDQGHPAALIDLRGLSSDEVFRSRLLDLSFSAEAPYGLGYDAMIYIRDGQGLA